MTSTGMTTPLATPAVEHADVVIVGSGFGGSVSAYRLAQAGGSVVVLERGNSYPPDSFPRTPAQMSKAFGTRPPGSTGCSTFGGSAAATRSCRAASAAAR